MVSFGAFVRIEEGLEGLIHISELAEGQFLHPRNVVQEGDKVRARILNIDPENHRIGLSLRRVRQEPLEAPDSKEGGFVETGPAAQEPAGRTSMLGL